MEYPIKTRDAVEIAHVDRTKFNEAVADGHYACAPALEGKSRVFGRDDLLILYLFGRLIGQEGQRYSTRIAGHIATKLHGCIRRSKDAKSRVFIIRAVNDAVFYASSDDGVTANTSEYAGLPVASVEVINLPAIRKMLDRNVALHGAEADAA